MKLTDVCTCGHTLNVHPGQYGDCRECSCVYWNPAFEAELPTELTSVHDGQDEVPTIDRDALVARATDAFNELLNQFATREINVQFQSIQGMDSNELWVVGFVAEREINVRIHGLTLKAIRDWMFRYDMRGMVHGITEVTAQQLKLEIMNRHSKGFN